jgi:uncharacterized protein
MKARLTLKVRAGARKTEFAGQYGDGWKLHVSAPPVDGKANHAILPFPAKLAGVPAGAVRVVSGLTSSIKIVELEGIDPEHLRRLILRAILESHGSSPHSGIAPSSKT